MGTLRAVEQAWPLPIITLPLLPVAVRPPSSLQSRARTPPSLTHWYLRYLSLHRPQLRPRLRLRPQLRPQLRLLV